MSTDVRTMFPPRVLTMSDERADGYVVLRFHGDHIRSQSVLTPRADLLAAVASELNVRIVPADAIVIERSELISATNARPYVYSALGYTTTRPPIDTDLLDRAWAHVGHLAEAITHLRENPPIDESQVAAVQAVLDTIDAADFDDLTLAARLVQNGLRVEGVTP